jgi:HEAT repeat protein
MKRLIVFAVLPWWLLGCQKAEPPLSGGRPVAHWVQALKDSDARTRKEAAFKLGNAGPVEASVLPALVAALKDADARVRCEVVLAVSKFGPRAKEAIPVLAELQEEDRDARVRSLAARALEKLRE